MPIHSKSLSLHHDPNNWSETMGEIQAHKQARRRVFLPRYSQQPAFQKRRRQFKLGSDTLRVMSLNRYK